ncbi:MAG: HlyD family efflux transporter periplasmic adaptor subunit [Proteobacteria bacterium]|nr:HlyD family efflux transporter periplasmic adaptor subunit [Pseudomonadota bacterium]
MSVWALALAACQKQGKGTGALAEASAPSKAAVAVKIAELKVTVTPRLVLVDAPMSGQHQADVYSKVIGRITYIGPKEGAAVKAGELLFRVDRSDPGESFLNMPTPSPISGWVGMWRTTTVGEQVTPAEPVVTIVDDRIIRAVAYLPAEDWTEVNSNTRVTANLGGQERAAKVVSIARSADLSSGRGSVTVEIPNPARDWRVGMYTRLRFEVQPKERLLLSSAALIITDQGAFVYITDGDTARRATVQYRVIDPDTVEITAGLPHVGKVVVAGANLLSDKSRVRIIE